MKHSIKRLAWTLIVGLLSVGVLVMESVALTDATPPRSVIYRLPLPDSPKVRVDGHVRGTDDAALTLTVLAPERVGLTTKEQPSLYWFQSKPVNNHFELTITEKDAIKPLLKAQFDASSSGVQRLRLSDHKIYLVEGVEYRWSVAIVLSPQDRSKDIVASGVIKRVPPAEKLQKRLRGAPASELPYIYADEGVWYDSLESLSELVDAKPQDAKLREIRAVYFMQVGLQDAAMDDMKSAGKKVTGETTPPPTSPDR